MKKLQLSQLIALLFGIALFPFFAMAARPTVELVGINKLDYSVPEAVVHFDPRDSEIGIFGDTQVMVLAEYTNTKTDESAVTAHATGGYGTQTYSFRMEDVQPGQTYSVVAVMRYQGKTYTSEPKIFTYKPETVTTGSTTTSGTTTTTNSTIATTPSITSIFGGTSSVKETVQKKVMTGGVTNKDGIGIAITNEQARVDARDTFTYTVRYQNGRTTSLKNGELVIELPENYEFVKSSADLDYDTRTNSLKLITGRIAAGTTKSFTFTARALEGKNDQVATKATLFYEGGSVTTADRDSFYGGSKSVLGASVFGAGFFPQTLFGWLFLIIMITLVIIVARRYTTAPTPQPANADQKPA